MWLLGFKTFLSIRHAFIHSSLTRNLLLPACLLKTGDQDQTQAHAPALSPRPYFLHTCFASSVPKMALTLNWLSPTYSLRLWIDWSGHPTSYELRASFSGLALRACILRLRAHCRKGSVFIPPSVSRASYMSQHKSRSQPLQRRRSWNP